MLSAHFVTQPGIKIDLPTASTAKFQTEEDIVISITADSVLYLNEEKIRWEDLLEKLKIKSDEFQKRLVIVKADERIDLGLVVKVMDISKQAKAEGLVLSTGTHPIYPPSEKNSKPCRANNPVQPWQRWVQLSWACRLWRNVGA